MFRRQTATSSTNSEHTIYERKQVQRKLNVSTQTDLRIILMGKTGNGKSSTGNSLLQKDVFKHKISSNAVTKKCEEKSGTDVSTSVQYTIVDTPGLLDTAVSISERALEIQRSVEICPEPYAFLIVFSATNRMTEDERFTIDMLRIAFGEKVFDHTIVVFTHGGEFQSDEEFEHFWTENEHFVKLIELCGNRVTRIENAFDFSSKNEGAETITRMVRKMFDEGNGSYNYKHLQIHKQVIQEHTRSYNGTGEIHDKVSDMVKRLGEKLDKKDWKPIVYGGLIGGAVACGAGAGYLAGAAGTEAVVASGLGATVIRNVAVIGGTLARSAVSVVTRFRFW